MQKFCPRHCKTKVPHKSLSKTDINRNSKTPLPAALHIASCKNSCFFPFSHPFRTDIHRGPIAFPVFVLRDDRSTMKLRRMRIDYAYRKTSV
ncbi:hypothetical protein CEXT_140301 [Caerostris extrusa]|uniref:Uncharacterized protein n=1 Tax=Caerostris extrusa TaxID=172846 RepID=A0AAV4XPU4_CAEEX|nr:hypothetical protein CEXT_140301 [Caerostris extrusa]